MKDIIDSIKLIIKIPATLIFAVLIFLYIIKTNFGSEIFPEMNFLADEKLIKIFVFIDFIVTFVSFFCIAQISYYAAKYNFPHKKSINLFLWCLNISFTSRFVLFLQTDYDYVSKMFIPQSILISSIFIVFTFIISFLIGNKNIDFEWFNIKHIAEIIVFIVAFICIIGLAPNFYYRFLDMQSI